MIQRLIRIVFLQVAVFNVYITPTYCTQLEPDSLRIHQLLDSAFKYKSRNIDSAYLDATLALKMSKKIGHKNLEERSHKALSAIYYTKGGNKDLKEAILHTLQAIELLKQRNAPFDRLRYNNNLAILHKKLHDWPKALDYAMSTIELLKLLHGNDSLKTTMTGAAHMTLASVYRNLGYMDSSLVNNKKAYTYYHSIKAPQEYMALANIANLYSEISKFEDALRYFHLSLKGFEKQPHFHFMARAYNRIGNVHFQMSNYDSARFYFRKAVDLSREKGLELDSKYGYFGLASTFHVVGLRDSLEYNLKQIEGIYDSLNYPHFYAGAIKLRAQLLEEEGKKDKAILFYKKYQTIMDSLKTSEGYHTAVEKLLAHQDKLNDQKIQELSNKLSKSELWILFISISLFFVLTVIFLLKCHYHGKIDLTTRQNSRLEATVENEKRNKENMRNQLVAANANLTTNVDILDQVHDLLAQVRQLENPNGFGAEIKATQQQIRTQKRIDYKWEAFFAHFEKIHPDFFKTLKVNYSLTPHELKICAFLKMNLSNKEICELLNINQNTIRVNVHRIKKKLDIDKELSVADFMEFA